MILFNTIYLQAVMYILLFVSIGYLIFCAYKKKLELIEIGLLLFINVVMLYGFNYVAERKIPNYIRQEVWNGFVTSVKFEEEWTERYTTTETYTDSKGKSHTKTVVKTRIHPNEWNLDSTVGSKSISQSEYNWYKSYREDLIGDSHGGQISFGDGRTFEIKVPIRDVPTSKYNTYKNYLSASQSILNKINPKLEAQFSKTLPNYPALHNLPNGSTILPRIIDLENIINYNDEKSLNDILNKFNGEFGAKKQFNLFIVFTKSTDYNYFLALQSKFVMGNKNDIIVVVGNGFIDTITYTEAIKFKTEISNIKYNNTNELVDKIMDASKTSYVRMPMDKFDSYKNTLTVPIKTDIILAVIFIIVEIICFIGIYCIDWNTNKRWR